MRTTLSRLPAVIARIVLLMFVFGLLSQSAQACLLSAPATTEAGVSMDAPCQTMDKHAGAQAKCASAGNTHSDVCFAQVSMTASEQRVPSPAVPMAIAVAPQLVSLVEPRQTASLAPPPLVTDRPHIPLSILHCSFQI